MMMSSSRGVMPVLALDSTARYWMNCECAVSGPGVVIGANAVHVPSGVGALPVRTLIATLVPAGVAAVHWILFQSTGLPASKTRDRNVPFAAYGVIRIQFTVTLPPNSLKSLAAIGRIGPVTVKGCEATRLPSM